MDAIASNYYPAISIDYAAATLFSLQRLLSSFRGRNDALLTILETKMRTLFGLGTLNQQLNLDYPAVAEEPEKVQDDWFPEDILSQRNEAISVTQLDTSDHGGQPPWASTGFSNTFDRPSPLHILLELDAQGAVEGIFMPATET